MKIENKYLKLLDKNKQKLIRDLEDWIYIKFDEGTPDIKGNFDTSILWGEDRKGLGVRINCVLYGLPVNNKQLMKAAKAVGCDEWTIESGMSDKVWLFFRVLLNNKVYEKDVKEGKWIPKWKK